MTNKGKGNRRDKPNKKGGYKKRKGPERTVNEAQERPAVSGEDKVRLNKYISHSGYCSRRDADRLIDSGKVQVNGKTVKELGISVKKTDEVVVEGQKISIEPFVYILLNKSTNVISTTNDEKDRKTVLNEIENATGYRVYPIGRLDRNTTGLLLLTNDGDLAHRLMHPSYKVNKTYRVQADRVLNDEELLSFKTGIELEDGVAEAYNIRRSYEDPSVFTLSVHEGRNRLIRRMVESFGTGVNKLKRTDYAGLNLKGVKLGRWRYLRQKEINNLRKLVKLEPLNFNKE